METTPSTNSPSAPTCTPAGPSKADKKKLFSSLPKKKKNRECNLFFKFLPIV